MTNQFVDSETQTDVNQPTGIPAGPDTPSAPISPPKLFNIPQAPVQQAYQRIQAQPPVPQQAQPNDVYEPESRWFNPKWYNDRFRAVAFHVQDSTGGSLPTPGIMHDFTRSGIPAYNLAVTYRQMLKDAATDYPYGQEAHQFTAGTDLPLTKWMPSDMQTQIEGKKIIVYPNAPFSGLRYSPSTDSYLYNPKSEAPVENDIRQLVKGALNNYSQQELSDLYTFIRNRNPDLNTGPIIPMLESGDVAGAIEKLAYDDPDIADAIHEKTIQDHRSFNFPPSVYYQHGHQNIYNTLVAQPMAQAIEKLNPDFINLPQDEQDAWFNQFMFIPGFGQGLEGIGSGSMAALKLARMSRYTKMADSLRAAGKEAEALRFEKNAATVDDLTKSVQSQQEVVKTLDDRITALDRPNNVYHYHGSPAANSEGIRQSGKISPGYKQSVYVTPDIAQARSFAGEGGSVFAVKTSELDATQLAKQAKAKPGSLYWRQALKQEGPLNVSFEVPAVGATKAANHQIKQDLISQWKDTHAQVENMKGIPAQEAAHLDKLTKGVTNAQEAANHLEYGRAFSNIEAAKAQAQGRIANAQIKLNEHMGKPSAFSQETLETLQIKEQQIEAALQHHIKNADLPAQKGVTELGKQWDALKTRMSQVGAYNRTFRNADVIDDQMSKLMDQQIDIGRKLADANNPANHLIPIRKALSQERVNAINQTMEHLREVQTMENMLRDMAGGREVPTSFRETGNIIINNWHDAKRFAQIDPGAIVSANANMLQNAKVMGERLFKEMHQLLNPSDRKIFIDVVENPALREQLSPGGQRAFDDLKALFADAGFLLKDQGMIKDLEDEYFPHFDSGTLRLARSSITGFKGELKTSAPYFKPRQFEEGTSKLGPEAQVKAYFQAVSMAHANRMTREVIKESTSENGGKLFIDSTVVPANGNPDLLPDHITKGNRYDYRPTLGGWVERNTSKELDRLVTPGMNIDEAVGRLAQFNNFYKKWAMRIPLVHFWNQMSAAIGVSPWITAKVLMGKAVARDPNILNDASKYMFVQSNRQIADVAQKIIIENPAERELAQALGFVTHESNIPVLTPTGKLFDHWLWDIVVRNQQVEYWHTLSQRLMKRGFSELDSKSAAGVLAQQIAGIQNPKMLQGWEKLLRDQVLFAYSWDKKHVTIPLQALPGVGRKFAKWFTPELTDIQAKAVESIARRYMIRYTTTAALSLTAMQMFLNGTTPWNNESGHWWDLEWTKVHDFLYGPDGKRHYIVWPFMNFARFYLYKAQLFADDGPIGGGLGNLANIAMPIPSIAINLGLNKDQMSLSSGIGSVVQAIDPWERNLIGPVVKNYLGQETGKTNMAELLATPLGLTGLHTYTGPHQAFKLTNQGLIHQHEIDMEIALHMHKSPLAATDADKAQAEKNLQGQSIMGVDVPELLSSAGGGFPGSGGPDARLKAELNTMIIQAAEEAGFLTEERVKKAQRDGEFLIKLLTPTQRKQIEAKYPEIQWALESHSENPDLTKQRLSDATSAYYYAIRNIQNEADSQERTIDAAKQSGQLSGPEWRKARLKNRSDEYQQIQGLKELPNAPSDQQPANASPEDVAWYKYHAINLDDSKYQRADFTQNIGQWEHDRKAVLASFSPEIQSYILNKDNQNRSDTEKQYEQAASDYGTFLDQHDYLVKQEEQAMSLSATERRIYLELHPEIKAFMAMRDNFYRKHPLVAEFYHPLDQDQWDAWKPDEQAVKLADWVIEYHIGHPDYLTAWQRSLIENKKALANAVSHWNDSQLALYYAYIQQEEIDYRNRVSGRRRASPYKAYGGAKNYYNHQYNVPFNQQHNVFSNTPPAAWNQKSIF